MKYLLSLLIVCAGFAVNGQTKLTKLSGLEYWNNYNITARLDSSGKWTIIDTMALIRTLYSSDSSSKQSYEKMRAIYNALADYVLLEEYLDSGHWNDSLKVKAFKHATAKFNKLRKQFS